jgi:hypothetical protein
MGPKMNTSLDSLYGMMQNSMPAQHATTLDSISSKAASYRCGGTGWVDASEGVYEGG